MSQVDQNLAFSIEIAVFISMDVVEAVVLREGRIWDNRRSVAFPVSELFDGAVFVEMARCGAMAVVAAILGADCFGVMGYGTSWCRLWQEGVGWGWCWSQWWVMVQLGREWVV